MCRIIIFMKGIISNTFRKISLVFILVAIAIGISGCSKKNENTRSIRIAIQPSAAFIPLYAVRYSGELENVLAKDKVDVVWQDFESGPPMNESLEADLIDIGVIGDVPTVLSLSRPTKMKLVGIPARGPDAYAVLASVKSGIKTFSELKGKRVATVFGSTGHNFIKKLLEKNHLQFSDIEFLNITAGSAEEVLTNSVADAVIIWEPNVTRLVDKGVARIIAQGSETNLRGTNGFVVREEYLSENEDCIKTLLEEYNKQAANLDSLNPEIKEKIAADLKITPDQLSKIIKKYDFDYKVTPQDVSSLQDTVSFLVSIKNLSREYRVDDFVVNGL